MPGTSLGERVALLLGLAVGVTPLYVRLSSSDSTHLLALPLWWLAALAVQRLVFGGGADRLVLFAAAVVACPIRIEAGLMMPSIVLFVGRDLHELRQVWQARRRWSPFFLGWLLGMACSVVAHHESWSGRLGSFSAPLFVIEMIARILFLVDVELLGWIPLFYVLLTWYYVYHVLQRHDRAELAATVLPFAVFSVPYAYTHQGIATNLPGAAYGAIINMFLLLGAAKGAVMLQDHLRAGVLGVRAGLRVPAIIVASLVLLGSFAIPYRRTYAYMEELLFLSRSLPRQKAKILAIWDVSNPGGDYDCCLALPYPTLVGDFPQLEWQILGLADTDEAHLRDLHFDYYYPGSLVAVDVDAVNTWFLGRLADRLFPDPQRNAEQQAPLRTLHSIDEFIRKNYPLTIYRQATMPAQTFSWAPLRDDRMTLTLYRHAAKPGVAGRRE